MCDFEDKEMKCFDSEYVEDIDYLDNLLKKYGGKYFRRITELSLENLRGLLIILLQAYQDRPQDFKFDPQEYIADPLLSYIHMRYKDEYPETAYPMLGKDDPRSVGLRVIQDFLQNAIFLFFPEDVPFFIRTLKMPPEKTKKANNILDQYARSVDQKKRWIEAHERGYLTVLDIEERKKEFFQQKEVQ